MAIFAVTYNYVDDPELVNQIRPPHRVWLQELLDQGVLLVSGPMVNRAASLLVFRSDSAEDLSALLDQDPLEVAGVISERMIEEWNTVFGPWS
ncbi:MAG: YciI family protein [Rhodoluna sp.]|nr:YciI family protein [Rhodoluna sp.]